MCRALCAASRISLPLTRLSLSETSSSSDESPEIHPALSREEIETLLADIPVYAVTQEQNGGIVLLSEEGNENGIAYFFLNPNTASASFKEVKAKQKSKDNDTSPAWNVTSFSLGLIWFELLFTSTNKDLKDRKSVVNGVEYRLVPDAQELGGARMLLTQAVQDQGGSAEDVPPIFQSRYNEIPVFIDPRLRIEQQGDNNEGAIKEQFPMYLGLQDLVTTCQQMMATSETQYDAIIKVADLHDLVRQMQAKSSVNFRQTIMVAPSNKNTTQTPRSDTPASDTNDTTPKSQDTAEKYRPTLTDDWSD